MKRFAFAAVLAALTVPALAADYQVNLGPMPLDDETKAVIAGRGEVAVSYDGKTLSVKGRFHGLPSAATQAHIFMGQWIGVPGKPVLDLNVDKATEGAITGELKLNAAEAKALKTGRLYIQVNSEKGPEQYPWGPKGTLWGWIFPAHETVGPNVPQLNHWFIPQLDTPSH